MCANNIFLCPVTAAGLCGNQCYDPNNFTCITRSDDHDSSGTTASGSSGQSQTRQLHQGVSERKSAGAHVVCMGGSNCSRVVMRSEAS